MLQLSFAVVCAVGGAVGDDNDNEAFVVRHKLMMMVTVRL